jgi:hypothetical protein
LEQPSGIFVAIDGIIEATMDVNSIPKNHDGIFVALFSISKKSHIE